MSAADLSLFVFGIYLIVVDGFGFLVIPNIVLRLFRLEEAKEIWIRILGFVIAMLGVYYIVGGLYHQTAFAWVSVFGRFSVLLFLIIIASLKKSKPTIILFGVVDTLSALWTLFALQSAI